MTLIIFILLATVVGVILAIIEYRKQNKLIGQFNRLEQALTDNENVFNRLLKSLETSNIQTTKSQIETIAKVVEVICKYESTDENLSPKSSVLYNPVEEYESSSLIDYNLINRKFATYS